MIVGLIKTPIPLLFVSAITKAHPRRYQNLPHDNVHPSNALHPFMPSHQQGRLATLPHPPCDINATKAWIFIKTPN